jgi:hypothetical protein
MAHIFPNSGLSAMAGCFPQTASAQPTAWWLGWFASQTSGTVPDRTAFGGATPGGWTESPSQARAAIAANAWLGPAVNGNGVRVTAAQVAITATGNGSANGFFIANRPSSVAADVIFYFANFDDLTTVTYNSGDVLRVTPQWQYNISAGA